MTKKNFCDDMSVKGWLLENFTVEVYLTKAFSVNFITIEIRF